MSGQNSVWVLCPMPHALPEIDVEIWRFFFLKVPTLLSSSFLYDMNWETIQSDKKRLSDDFKC